MRRPPSPAPLATIAVPSKALLALRILRDGLGASAVTGGLRPHSDVDILAVVTSPPDMAGRRGLAAMLLDGSGRDPVDPGGRRPLEVIVVDAGMLASPPCPARVDFIYGEWLRDAYERGDDPSGEAGPDMTLLLAQAQRSALPMAGPPFASWDPGIPPDQVRLAIRDLLPAIVEATGDERNRLLMLARMWRTLETRTFARKEAAAEWAEARLPPVARDAMTWARRSYLGSSNRPAPGAAAIRRTIAALAERIIAAPGTGRAR